MTEINQDPSRRSLDMEEMAPHWTKIDAILGGTQAMRDNATEFLPKFPDEPEVQYSFRVSTSKFTNIFRDITENLSQRPFAHPVELEDGTYGDEIGEFIEDVDGQGSTMHAFAAESFFAAINYGIDWILVDYTPDVPANATRAQERKIGARPYWVRYNASSVLAVHSRRIGGKEVITHFRVLEPTTEIEGFEEKHVNRVRVIERKELANGALSNPVSTLWTLERDQDGEATWVAGEPKTMTIGEIPVVPVLLGWRMGDSWQIHPPMQAAAELQIEHFEQESALKYARTMAAFPMLAGQGVTPELDETGNPKPIPVGPHRIVFAGEGHFEWIEPSSESLRFLSGEIEKTARELRELGRQPLTAQSGNLTTITTMVAAQKASSAIQAWALMLGGSLENCLWLTAQWLKVPDEPVVAIDLDFDLSTGEDDGYGHVLSLRKQGDIGRLTVLREAKRRGILDRKFDPTDDTDGLTNDITDDEEGDDE